ncbi:MFS transporter [candidate division WWE3 bacterium]|nr:MFS transporter [candidate division WWE3 bacterium]
MSRQSRALFGEINRLQLPVGLFAIVVLFWTIFDSIISYITPVLIDANGFSTLWVGIILGSSSMAGALFDFLICKFVKNIRFRPIFIVMFAICAFYPLILWRSHSVAMFLLAMALWGIYYDLYGFGTFSFISKYTKKDDHSLNFGLVQVFRSLGSILAPIIVGLVIVEAVDWRAISLSWVFLAISFAFFIVLMLIIFRRFEKNTRETKSARRKSLLVEVHLWKKIGRKMMPVLVLSFFLYFTESFFWTLAPLYAETTRLGEFGGLFLTMYMLPSLLVGWFIEPLTKKMGKKRVAITAVLIGSALLAPFYKMPDAITALIFVFIGSLFMSMALPAINAAYADYISESPQVEGEIESLEDFAFNLGYIIGPITAGFLADALSISRAFSALGYMGVGIALVLLIITPKHISVRTTTSDFK